jgi:rhomboid family GlyGly-CTERM serine protease
MDPADADASRVVQLAASSFDSERVVKVTVKPAAMQQGGQLPWRALLLAALGIAAYLGLGAAPEAWVFDRLAIADGEWWRLITGHWVHGDPGHAGWDISMLLLFGALFEPRLKWLFPLALLVSSLAVDAWLWWGVPDLRLYCGLSGILNGLLIVGLLQWWRETRHPLMLLTAAAAAVKIAVEIHAGQALLTQTAWPSVPTAHAAGYLCGLLLAAIAAWLSDCRYRKLWQLTERHV